MNPEELIKELAASSKPRKVAGVFDTLPLPEHIDKHFKSPGIVYLWDTNVRECKEVPALDGRYMGVWLCDTIPYVHIVLVSKEVLEYIIAPTKLPL